MSPVRPTISAILVLLLAACVKNNNGGTSNGTCTATVNGKSFKATSSLGAYSTSLNVIGVFARSIAPGDTTSFQIVTGYPPPLNTPIVSDSLVLNYYITGTEYDAYSSRHQVQLTITTLDGRSRTLAGSFSAIAHSSTNYNDSVVVTNGSFSCTYNVSP